MILDLKKPTAENFRKCDILNPDRLVNLEINNKRRTQALFNLEINKKSGSSIDLDIHHLKFSALKTLEW